MFVSGENFLKTFFAWLLESAAHVCLNLLIYGLQAVSGGKPRGSRRVWQQISGERD